MIGVRVLWGALAVQVVLGVALLVWGLSGFPLPGSADDPEPAAARPAAARPTVDRFDAGRAFALLRRQVERYGPRPAGSRASRRLTEDLRRRLPRGRIERFRAGGQTLRNVVGTLPGAAPALVVAAHHDTETGIPGFVGANDGASGVAVVVELARALRALPAAPGAREVRFVLFDGEESPVGCTDFLRCGVRGSRAYLAAHPGEVGQLVLLDMVGDRDLEIPREEGSDPALWERLRAAAGRVGTQRVFPDATRGPILDDHTPFVQAGVPAIDVIDFTYPEWHTPADRLDRVSARSLDAVGETVLDLVLELRGG